MTRRLRYLDTARDELAQIAVYIAEQAFDRAVAERFVARLHDKCRSLAALPGTLGTARPELGKDIRSTPYEGYTIFFRYRPGYVEIISVMHGSRDVEARFT